MKNIRIFSICLGCLATLALSAQISGSKTSYFMDNAPFSNELNPAIQPYRGYINLGIGNTIVNVNSGAVSLDKLVFVKPNGSIDFTLNDPNERTKMVGNFSKDNKMMQSASIQPFGFGFYTRKFFWTFNVAVKEQMSEIVPRSFFELVASGNNPSVSNYDLKSSNLRNTTYAEAALGTSYKVNDKLTVGAKVKYIAGTAYFDAAFDQFDITMTNLTWRTQLKGKIKTSLTGYQGKPGDQFDFDVMKDGVESSLKKPAGSGFGVDLGFTFKPIKPLTLSAAITDLGAISWSKKNNTTGNINYDFTLLDASKPIIDALPDFPKVDITNGISESFTTSLPTSINAGAEFAFLKNRMSVGLLSTNRIGEYANSEWTFSVNMKPMKIFNVAVSYTGSNLKFNSFGAAMSWTPYWFLNMFIATDYVFYNLTPQYVPIYANHLNAQFGVTIPLAARKKPKDKIAPLDSAPIPMQTDSIRPAKNDSIEPFRIR